MAMICNLCHKTGRRNQLIINCAACSLGFHRTCLGVSYGEFYTYDPFYWTCGDCTTRLLNKPKPVFPPEIESFIVSHLERMDLFACRVVSKFWNQQCLHFLRKSNNVMHLDQDNIHCYAKFVKRPEDFILPIHVNFNVDSLENLGLGLGSYETYDAAVRNGERKMRRIAQAADKLQAIFGPKCISGFSLGFYPAGNSMNGFNAFLSLLCKISAGLSTFNSFTKCDPSAIPHVADGMLSRRSMEFPLLKKLKYYAYADHTPTFDFLAGRSPNLQELHLKYFFRPKFNWVGLEALKIRGGISSVLDFIRSSNPETLPSLRKISFRCRRNEEEKEVLGYFSSTLKSMTCIGDQLPQFPSMLPHLHHLRLREPSSQSPCANIYNFLNPEGSNVDQDSLPALSSIDFPFGSVFCPTTFSPVLPTVVILRSVQELTLRVKNPASPTDADLEVLEETEFNIENYVAHLEATFPNLRRLRIINVGSRANSAMGDILQGFMNSKNAPNIETLTIQNYDSDYLGNICTRPPPPQLCMILENFNPMSVTAFKEFSVTALNKKFTQKTETDTDGTIRQILIFDTEGANRMTNVRKIQLESSAEENKKLAGWKNWSKSELPKIEFPKKIINLAAIQPHFPSTHFEISRVICGIPAKDVQDTFPNLTITLIHQKPSKGPRCGPEF